VQNQKLRSQNNLLDIGIFLCKFIILQKKKIAWIYRKRTFKRI